VKTLLSHGANVNARERRGQSALMWAAAEGHAEVVEVLIQSGADFQTALPSGFTPLFFAVREGRTRVVHALLEAGADVNRAMKPESKRGGKSPKPGTSPLILAVENGHFQLAFELLEAGADPNDQRSGFTALHTLTWVRKPGRGDSAAGDPAPAGSGNLNSLQFARELVACGADVNFRLERGSSGRGRVSMQGATPFLMAASNADGPLMRLLVELGADPLIPNVDNCTPLMAAAGVGTLAPGEEAGTELDECGGRQRRNRHAWSSVQKPAQDGSVAGRPRRGYFGLEPQEQVRMDAVDDRRRLSARQFQTRPRDDRRHRASDAGRRNPASPATRLAFPGKTRQLLSNIVCYWAVDHVRRPGFRRQQPHTRGTTNGRESAVDRVRSSGFSRQ
jgi:ankyrin repeat protein